MPDSSAPKLGRLAREAYLKAYSPYSGVKVGAALLTSDKRVYTGCNVENSSYGLTICAERVAATKAVSGGSIKFKKIAIASNLQGYIFPCGACRQFLAEFSDGLKILLFSESGKSKDYSLEELLPEAFVLKKRGSRAKSA